MEGGGHYPPGSYQNNDFDGGQGMYNNAPQYRRVASPPGMDPRVSPPTQYVSGSFPPPQMYQRHGGYAGQADVMSKVKNRNVNSSFIFDEFFLLTAWMMGNGFIVGDNAVQNDEETVGNDQPDSMAIPLLLSYISQHLLLHAVENVCQRPFISRFS